MDHRDNVPVFSQTGLRVFINDVPADVLILIFEEVNRVSHYHVPVGQDSNPGPDLDVDMGAENMEVTMAHCQSSMISAPSPLRTASDEHSDTALSSISLEEDPFTATSFPEALASVCVSWRSILSSVSAFWTCLVIFVDQPFTPLSTIRSFLAFSGQRPIDVHILRRFNRTDGSDSFEAQRVAAVMKLLYPHMARWRILRISVRQTTSLMLPRIGLDHSRQPTLPSLTRLTLSASAPGSKGTWLSVGDLVAFINLSTCLVFLELIGLDLPCGDGPPALAKPARLIETVIFTDTSSVFLIAFYRYRYGEVAQIVEFKRSCIVIQRDEVDFVVSSSHVILTDIGVLRDLVSTLVISAGNKLTINNCIEFPQAVALFTPLPADLVPFDSRWIWPNLRHLHISDSPQISVHLLRAVVLTRLKAREVFATSNDPSFNVATIEELCVARCGELSEDGRRWFESHVNVFSWT